MQSCYKCQERTVDCHSTCEKYIKERKELDIRNEQIRKQKKKEDHYTVKNFSKQITKRRDY